MLRDQLLVLQHPDRNALGVRGVERFQHLHDEVVGRVRVGLHSGDEVGVVGVILK